MLLTDIGIGEGLIDSLICILIVFLILTFICLIVSLFRFINKPNKTVEDTTPVENKKFTIDDITDEDMMAAALVATIDYRQEVGTDVRLVSIKEIK